MSRKIIVILTATALSLSAFYLLTQKFGGFYASVINLTNVFSRDDFSSGLSQKDSQSDVKIVAQSDVSQSQEGSSFYVKLMYKNETDLLIAKSALTTMIYNSEDFLMDSFTNGTDIAAGDSIINSISLPNKPGQNYFITCGKQFICEGINIQIPSPEEKPKIANLISAVIDELPSADFAIDTIRADLVDGKMKITFEYSQSTSDNLEADLEFQYTIRGENSPSTLLGKTGTKIFKKNKKYYGSFSVLGSPNEVELVLDPQNKLNDRSRKNNFRTFRTIIDSSSDLSQGIDLNISRIVSKLVRENDEEMIKLYVEFNQNGNAILDLSDLDLQLILPYQGSDYLFENFRSGKLSGGKMTSFSTFLPLSLQGNKVIIKLDPKGKYNDTNGENNSLVHILPQIDDPYLDFQILNSDFKIMEENSTKMIKVYVEFTLEGAEEFSDGLDFMISDLIRNEIIYYEENIAETGIKSGDVNSFVAFIPFFEGIQRLKVEIDPSMSVNDPARVNNTAYLSVQ